MTADTPGSDKKPFWRRADGRISQALSWFNILTMPAIALVFTTAAYQSMGYDPSNGFALVMSVLLVSGGATHAVGQSWEYFVVDPRGTRMSRGRIAEYLFEQGRAPIYCSHPCSKAQESL